VRLHKLVTLLVGAVAIATGSAYSAEPVSAGQSFLEGIDVSAWQGKPRWAAVKNAGIKFVIVKATAANAKRDSEYLRNRRLLRKQGIPFTAYHHAKPDATPGDAIAEADFFVDTAGLNGNNLLPALDLKTHGVLSVEALTAWVKAWLGRVEERLGVKPMIYAPTPLWVDWMGDTTWFAENGYRFWVRDWGVTAPSVPASNWGGRGWTLWQNGKAAVPGIVGKVDTNLYNGTLLAPIRIKNNR
jgi:lysozyme